MLLTFSLYLDVAKCFSVYWLLPWARELTCYCYVDWLRLLSLGFFLKEGWHLNTTEYVYVCIDHMYICIYVSNIM